MFRPYFGGSLESWSGWEAFLKVVYPLMDSTTREERDLIRKCTGRKRVRHLVDGFSTVLCLTGRRSGKSRVAALVGAYEAALAGHEKHLSPGEQGLVVVVAPSKNQAKIVKGYIRAVFRSPLLARQVHKEDPSGFTLRNGVRIEILAGSFRTVRGFSLLAAVIDEAAFFFSEDTNVHTDSALVQALKPALATTGGKLIAISTKYSRKGWCWRTHRRNFGASNGKVLVWDSSSRTMNPTLSQQVIDDALAEDFAAARSEYLGEWRDDVALFLTRALISKSVIRGRNELPPAMHHSYVSFADLGGGRVDSAALAIAHREGTRVVIDALREFRAPFAPMAVVGLMSEQLRRFGVSRVTGDNYSAEYTADAFRRCGISYDKSPKPKAALYLELLPRLTSGEVELLDDARSIEQLASLERRVRAGGRDVVDHPHGSHDDLANVIAGVVVEATRQRQKVGLLLSQSPTGYPMLSRPVTRDDDPIGFAIRDMRRNKEVFHHG